MTHTDSTPIWFLDVDGVINAMSWSVPDHYSQGSASPFRPENFSVADRATDSSYLDEDEKLSRSRYQIRWNPDVVDRMVELHTEGRVKLVWLTTWGSGANFELGPLLGIPELEVVAEPPPNAWLVAGGGGQTWWKHSAVIDYVAQSTARKFIWTDDDLAIEAAARSWSRTRDDVYTLAPSQYTGITPEELLRIERFLRL